MASQLPPDVVTAFQQLLQGLASSDNTLRKSAEDRLNDEWVKTRPDMLLLGMVEQIRDGTDSAVGVPTVGIPRRGPLIGSSVADSLFECTVARVRCGSLQTFGCKNTGHH